MQAFEDLGSTRSSTILLLSAAPNRIATPLISAVIRTVRPVLVSIAGGVVGHAIARSIFRGGVRFELGFGGDSHRNFHGRCYFDGQTGNIADPKCNLVSATYLVEALPRVRAKSPRSLSDPAFPGLGVRPTPCVWHGATLQPRECPHRPNLFSKISPDV